MEKADEIWWRQVRARLHHNAQELAGYNQRTVCKNPRRFSRIHYACWCLSEDTLWLRQFAQKNPENRDIQIEANYAQLLYKIHFGEEFQE